MKIYGVYCGVTKDDILEVELFAKKQDAERFAAEVFIESRGYDSEYFGCNYFAIEEVEMH